MRVSSGAQRLIHEARDAAILWWRVVRATYLRFTFNPTDFMAAGIAFYALICLGPLSLLLAAGLQFILGPGTDTYHRVEKIVSELGAETADQVMPQVNALLQDPHAYAAGVVSIVMLLWASMKLFEVVERSLTEIWPGKVLRNFFTRKLVSLAMLGVAGLLLAAFLLVNALGAVLRAWLSQIPGVDPADLQWVRPQLAVGLQLGLSILAFALLYKFLPVKRPPFRVAVAGAVCAGLIWQCASPLFTYLMALSPQRNAFYGGLAGVVIYSLWALLGAQVLLVGAHFAASYEHVFVHRRGPEEDDMLIGIAQRKAERQWRLGILEFGRRPPQAAADTEQDAAEPDPLSPDPPTPTEP